MYWSKQNNQVAFLGISLRNWCLSNGIIEGIGLALSLYYKINLLYLLPLGKVPIENEYAVQMAKIFSGSRLIFEGLQFIPILSLLYGVLKEDIAMVNINLQSIRVYAVLSPILFWELLYVQEWNLVLMVLCIISKKALKEIS